MFIIGIQHDCLPGAFRQGTLDRGHLFNYLNADFTQVILSYIQTNGDVTKAKSQAILQQGDEPEAVRVWFQGFQATGSPIFLSRLEEHYLKREEPLQAIEALKRCIASARKDTLARFHLGKLYFRLEMLDDAMSVLQSLEGLASYAPTLHYLLGRIHERRGQFNDASKSYRKVIKEMDLVQLEYRCRHCESSLVAWEPRCPSCGDWNGVEVNFREEIPLEELGLSAAPIYTTRD